MQPARMPVSSSRAYRVLVTTNMFPLENDPARGAFVKAQVSGLQERGVPVEVFHVRGDRGVANYRRAVSEIRQMVAETRADIVYAFYGLTGWVSLWQPCPVVLSLAGDDVLGTPDGRGGLTLKSRIGIVLSQWAAHKSAVVCVQSEEMRERLWGERLRRKALVMPYGVDSTQFSPGEQVAARNRLGIPRDDLLVVFPNTPTERRKRFDIAEQAIDRLRPNMPNLRLLVVTGVSHSDMPDYYRAADCCLLTSDWEGSPNVIKEALLCGLPVVTTDVGDVRKWIPLSPESVICQQTPDAVATALLRVLLGRKRVDPSPYVSQFGAHVITERMIAVFDQVLQG